MNTNSLGTSAVTVIYDHSATLGICVVTVFTQLRTSIVTVIYYHLASQGISTAKVITLQH